MEAVWPMVLLLGGILMVVAGARLATGSTRRLRRAGVFQGLFWASFTRFAGYRLRSLRPAGGIVFGAVLVGGGLGALYLGLTTFYAARLLRLSG